VPTVVPQDVEGSRDDEPPQDESRPDESQPDEAQADEPQQDEPPSPFGTPEPKLPPVAARVVSAFRSRPARREEVTVPYAAEPSTLGMLALSDPLRRHQQDLPEVGQLRYLADEVAPQPEPDPAAADRGNVSLIIDATTDLSRRAMSKVRRPTPLPAPDDGEAVDPEPVEVERLLIGAELARARHQLGLTVDDLADRTRIRPSVIEALEVDDFGPARGDFYARGHLRMIARVLGIDAGELLSTYDAHFATNPVSPRQVFEVELASGTTGMVQGTRGGSRWGGLIAAVLVLMIVWGLAQYFIEDTTPASDADVPQNSAGLGSPGVGNPAPPPVTEDEARFKATAVGGESWVVVRDGSKEEIFAGRLLDGESRTFEGEAPLRVLAMKGGVVSVSVKGRDLGLIGELGETRARTKVDTGRDRTAGSRGGEDGADNSAP
jgi:cytoskeletal protein RodZ